MKSLHNYAGETKNSSQEIIPVLEGFKTQHHGVKQNLKKLKLYVLL